MKKGQFLPWTETSRRRPTPTKFAHLKRWIEEVKRDIKITNISEMTNINQQLEQNAELYVSNIISRVIAQLIGKYGDGFVTIEATEAGRLKVETQNDTKTVLQADINFAAAASNEIIAAVAGKKIKIVNIFFTAFGEVNLTFQSAANALSGAMDFGAADEPRGMVVPFGDFPMETVAGEAFNVLASTTVQVSGYCNYYVE